MCLVVSFMQTCNNHNIQHNIPREQNKSQFFLLSVPHSVLLFERELQIVVGLKTQGGVFYFFSFPLLITLHYAS